MSDPRENLQSLARKKWLESARKNSIILPTGSGKSKVAIDIIKELNPGFILLLTNSERLRDETWKAEFIKFGAEEYWDCTLSECYQTMHSRTGEWDLIIFDEIDFACTEVYGKCLSQNNLKSKWVLGLTGFITEEKEQFLEYFYPICYKAHIEDLQEQNILNQSEFIMVEFPIFTSKTITQQTKTGRQFLVSENDQYKYWDGQFQKAVIVKKKKHRLRRKYRLLHQPFEGEKDWMAADWKFKITAAKRKKLLHTLESTIKVTKNLVDRIHATPGNKGADIQHVLTTECDKLPNPYHGKSDEEVKGIEKLNTGEINTLSVVKKITRGEKSNRRELLNQINI